MGLLLGDATWVGQCGPLQEKSRILEVFAPYPTACGKLDPDDSHNSMNTFPGKVGL